MLIQTRVPVGQPTTTFGHHKNHLREWPHTSGLKSIKADTATTIDKLEHLEEITAAIDENYLSHHEEIAEMKNHVQFLKTQIMRNNIQQV